MNFELLRLIYIWCFALTPLILIMAVVLNLFMGLSGVFDMIKRKEIIFKDEEEE